METASQSSANKENMGDVLSSEVQEGQPASDVNKNVDRKGRPVLQPKPSGKDRVQQYLDEMAGESTGAMGTTLGMMGGDFPKTYSEAALGTQPEETEEKTMSPEEHVEKHTMGEPGKGEEHTWEPKTSTPQRHEPENKEEIQAAYEKYFINPEQPSPIGRSRKPGKEDRMEPEEHIKKHSLEEPGQGLAHTWEPKGDVESETPSRESHGRMKPEQHVEKYSLCEPGRGSPHTWETQSDASSHKSRHRKSSKYEDVEEIDVTEENVLPEPTPADEVGVLAESLNETTDQQEKFAETGGNPTDQVDAGQSQEDPKEPESASGVPPPLLGESQSPDRIILPPGELHDDSERVLFKEQAKGKKDFHIDTSNMERPVQKEIVNEEVTIPGKPSAGRDLFAFKEGGKISAGGDVASTSTTETEETRKPAEDINLKPVEPPKPIPSKRKSKKKGMVQQKVYPSAGAREENKPKEPKVPPAKPEMEEKSGKSGKPNEDVKATAEQKVSGENVTEEKRQDSSQNKETTGDVPVQDAGESDPNVEKSTGEELVDAGLSKESKSKDREEKETDEKQEQQEKLEPASDSGLPEQARDLPAAATQGRDQELPVSEQEQDVKEFELPLRAQEISSFPEDFEETSVEPRSQKEREDLGVPEYREDQDLVYEKDESRSEDTGRFESVEPRSQKERGDLGVPEYREDQDLVYEEDESRSEDTEHLEERENLDEFLDIPEDRKGSAEESDKVLKKMAPQVEEDRFVEELETPPNEEQEHLPESERHPQGQGTEQLSPEEREAETLKLQKEARLEFKKPRPLPDVFPVEAMNSEFVNTLLRIPRVGEAFSLLEDAYALTKDLTPVPFRYIISFLEIATNSTLKAGAVLLRPFRGPVSRVDHVAALAVRKFLPTEA